ncbi:MAG: ribonuclease HII [Alphaproteobacteria bacterium]|nr:ribonuclease HII [Alphaproteobacteria bacterium]
MPDFSLEREVEGVVVGIDEAGRGPWAGPVVAGAAVLDRESLEDILIKGLDDSKALTPAKRDSLYAALSQSPAATVSVGIASVEEIDSLNILQATFLAMSRALETLAVPVDFALVDGNRAPKLICPTRTVVKGDSRSLSIAAGSIMAKVTRDRVMAKLAVAFPGYAWETNQGYGTPAHKQGLEDLGVTPHHRKSYAPIRALLEKP